MRLCMALVPYTAGGQLSASLVEVTIAEFSGSGGGWACADPFCGFFAEDHGALENLSGPGKRKLYNHWLTVHRALLFPRTAAIGAPQPVASPPAGRIVPRLTAVSTSQYLGSTPFRAAGGCFAGEKSFGWHVTDEKGFTVAIACHDGFAERSNQLEQFVADMLKLDAVDWLAGQWAGMESERAEKFLREEGGDDSS